MNKNNVFISKGFVSSNFFNLTPKEAYTECMNSNAIIVDVREKNLTGYKKINVSKVIYIPNSEINIHYERLPKDKPLIIADSVGIRSKESILFLIEMGFHNIANLAGGIVEWEQDGLPIIINKKEQLDGSCMCQLRPRSKK